MRIHHVALYVNDLEAAKHFFVRYFGATSNEGYHNPRTDFRSYMLSFDDGARVELMTRPAMQEKSKTTAVFCASAVWGNVCNFAFRK